MVYRDNPELLLGLGSTPLGMLVMACDSEWDSLTEGQAVSFGSSQIDLSFIFQSLFRLLLRVYMLHDASQL
jgi:hypothetical protein